jgi:hypothetical protein
MPDKPEREVSSSALAAETRRVDYARDLLEISRSRMTR